MDKKKTPVLIPLIIVGGIILYCWTVIIATELLATWRHYLGLVLYLLLLVVLFKNFTYATIGLGVYLLFASFALLAITPSITTNWIRIGPVSTPPIHLLSAGIFITYAILNFNSLVDYYLDYKEGKLAGKKALAANGKAIDDK